jgi:tRNA threonylcarbamoyladenosine biosynthesis protein TsaB
MSETPKTILAIDTAGPGCSAALWGRGAILAGRREFMARGQSERLVPMVLEVMTEAGVPFSALDMVAVSVGPGAFTGVRIGLSAAKGFSLALAIPIMAVTSFEAVAAAVPAEVRAGRLLAIALESKRDDLYLQLFDDAGRARGEPAAIEPAALSGHLPELPLLFAGDAKERAVAALGAWGDVRIFDGDDAADAAQIAALAATRDLAPGSPVGPLYLRAPDVTLPAGLDERR